jgi:lipopolysaccharide/colanic/teichoic acid biosynthesis glycosyltransferase
MYQTLQKKKKSLFVSFEKYLFRIGKRTLDIVVSSIFLLIFSPLLMLISIIIKVSDGGPIIYKQKRAGLHNSDFWIYKFRSMRTNTLKKNEESNKYYWEDGVSDNFVFKMTTEKNPNITSVGRFLRKYSLDEIPQFINVLKGEMSIVGPRPEITDITRFYNENQQKRLNVKPGITGFAQVNGRSEIPHGKKIEFDLYYVRNQSLLLDIKIVFITAYQTIFGKGAI